MALADFFPRDALAISQVLQGLHAGALVEKLRGIRVAIAFGPEAANSRDGRALLEFFVRLVARLYPRLTFTTVPVADRYADELMALARSINPNVAASTRGVASVGLAIGTDAPAVDAPMVYAGCDGWVARVGMRGGPYAVSDGGNPFGAGFAACLAAANVFRFLFLAEGANAPDDDVLFPADAGSFSGLTEFTLAAPLVLVGNGAVGNSAAWALARTKLVGEIHLVDPQIVEIGNLQRYVLCARRDAGRAKVEIVGKALTGTLQGSPHRWGPRIQLGAGVGRGRFCP